MPCPAVCCKVSISIHAPREGGDFSYNFLTVSRIISIHAPREGGDQNATIPMILRDISIHAPREGGDLADDFTVMLSGAFQSTPPARGATLQSH